MNTMIIAGVVLVALLAGLLWLRREKREVIEAVERIYAYSNSGEIVGVVADAQDFSTLPVAPATVKESLPVQVAEESLATPERDDNQLISRVELERLRGIEYAARAFRNSKAPNDYVKMCDAMGELP